MRSDSDIQPACPQCTVELNVDGTCPQCSLCPKCSVKLRPDGTCPKCNWDDAPVTAPPPAVLTEMDLALAVGLCLTPDTSDDGLTMLSAALDDSPAGARFEVQSFADAGVRRFNNGLVLRLGVAEYQITVVRVR